MPPIVLAKKGVISCFFARAKIGAHVPPVPSIEHCKREQYSSITGGNFGGYPARCVRYASVGSLPPFEIGLCTIPGKLLGSFGSQFEPQNATNIALHVPWIF